MRQTTQAVPARTHCVLSDRRQLFTDVEALALRVGEMDLEKERSQRRRLLNSYFEGPGNALADRRLEALRALVVSVGLAKNDAALEAACLAALASGLSEVQIAFLLTRYRGGRDKSKHRSRRGS